MSLYLQHFNNEFFLEKTNQLTVVKSVRHRQAKYYFNELAREYSKNITDIKIKLEDVYHNSYHNYDYFNVVFIDSFQSFRIINPGPKTVTKDFSEYYLIILYFVGNNPEQEIQNIFDYFWSYYTVNVALLLQTAEDKRILLYTYYPFTPKSCHSVQLDIINRNKSITNLKGSELFPNKFMNFHNCSLMAALWNVPPYLMLPKSGNNLNEMEGMEGFLLTVLADVLNFKINYTTPPNNEQRGLVRPNGTVTGAIKMLNDRVADLSLGSFRCTLERSTALSPSITYYQTMQVFTVLALREPWTSFEIIAYPFDNYIWLVLLVLMLFLLSSPHILQHLNHKILKFIYGFSSPNFININIIATTLGQTAHLLPQRNFARYILLMWILLTMILRSIYEGSLYEFLKSQKTIAPPDTSAELTERKYKLILNVATGDSFSGIQVIRDNLLEVLIMDISDAGGFPLLEANPDIRYVTGTPKDFLTYYVNTYKKFGVFHVLKETIFSQQLCMYFTKHSYLVVTFDHVLQHLRSFGIINYWAKFMLDDQFLEEVKEILVETPLTYDQLSGIVKICLFLYLISFVVFVCEIMWFNKGKSLL